MKKETKNPLQKIKSGRLTRTLDFVSMIASSGQKALSYKIQSKMTNISKETLAIELLKKQIYIITEKFGNLKGGLMKVGQMLSVYGEYFLPADVNVILKNLQAQSTPFEWAILKKVLSDRIGVSALEELEIDPVATASASLGQVHKAKIKSTGEVIALKIQYPDVDKAVKNDLKALKSILKVADLFPQISHLDLLFDEVQSMLYQELDYLNEMKWTNQFRQALQGDSRYIVPKTYPDYTNTKVIATSFETGVNVDSPEVLGLSQERRNQIALAALDLYFKELFQLGFVQTDPHIGNYKIQLNAQQDKIILFDFGAVREFSDDFLTNYRGLIKSALNKDYKGLEEFSLKLKFTEKNDPQKLKDSFYQFCNLMVEPFTQDVYDWGNTDLPKRLTKMVAEVIMEFKVRTPPREVVFLDRKTTGVFIFLSILKAKISARDLLEKYL
ncbi:MAG: AarF/ABC1/UbiB kinase family protein [Bdellovibrionota bacterium]